MYCQIDNGKERNTMKLNELHTIFGCLTLVELVDCNTNATFFNGWIDSWDEDMGELEVAKISPAILRLYDKPGVVIRVY